MRVATIALVVAGMALAVALGISYGFDTTGVVILAFVVAFGALSVAVVRTKALNRVVPARCHDCDGLISPSSPYCKHCGATRS